VSVPIDKTAVFAAARRVFEREGLGGLSLEAVALDASLSVESLQATFGDAPAMQRELMALSIGGPIEVVEAAVEAAPDGAAALDAFLRAYIRHQLDHLTEARLHLANGQPTATPLGWTSETLAAQVIPLTDRLYGGVEKKLRAEWGDELPQGIHPRRLVFVAHAAALGMLAFRTMVDRHGDRLRHGDEDLIDELSRALVSPTSTMRQLSRLNDVAASLGAMRSEDELRERVSSLLRSSLDVETALFLTIGSDGTLELASVAGVEPALAREFTDSTKRQDVPPPPHYRRALETNQTIFVERPWDEPDWPSVPAELVALYEQVHQNGPFVVTPVRIDGTPIGVVAGHARRHGRGMDRRDVERVETFATMVGLALANVRFYDTLNAKVAERTRSLRDAQAALVQSEKMAALGQLVAGVAHEINTPVGAIHSGVDVAISATAILEKALEKAGALDERKVQRALKVLKEGNETGRIATERIIERVRALKNFARLDEADRKQADLHEGLDTTLMLLRHETRNVEIVRNYGQLRPIDCFPNQLNQVFMNLLVNGIQAMDGHGTITIDTRESDGEVFIRVADTGKGIAPEDMGRIFDPGFTRKGVGVGTGLGLAISHQIIEKHGGRIEVVSELGSGATFTICLPLPRP